jgi:hypothetical protein
VTARVASHRLAPLIAGALASLALRALPIAGVELFRSTLAILPLSLGAAWSIERFMRERGLATLDARE